MFVGGSAEVVNLVVVMIWEQSEMLVRARSRAASAVTALLRETFHAPPSNRDCLFSFRRNSNYDAHLEDIRYVGPPRQTTSTRKWKT